MQNPYNPVQKTGAATVCGKLHFLNTGASDCILLESDGHFALIDAAEDSDFPADKPHLNTGGYEAQVVEYLLAHCRGADGLVTLDFVLGTHAHSDHIGGFDTVVRHPQIRVKQAYLRPYNAAAVFFGERLRWDNQEVYDQMLAALRDTNTPLEPTFDRQRCTLGRCQVTFRYCGVQKKRLPVKFGENHNTVVTEIEAGNTHILLAGDMNYKSGDERRIAKAVGKVDLLKVGHHGLVGSTSFHLLKALMPRIAVVTNSKNGMYPDVRYKLTRVARTTLYTTVDANGVLATFDAQGGISIETNIM